MCLIRATNLEIQAKKEFVRLNNPENQYNEFFIRKLIQAGGEKF
jgi:hypothetical protein